MNGKGSSGTSSGGHSWGKTDDESSGSASDGGDSESRGSTGASNSGFPGGSKGSSSGQSGVQKHLIATPVNLGVQESTAPINQKVLQVIQTTNRLEMVVMVAPVVEAMEGEVAVPHMLLVESTFKISQKS